MAKWMRDRGFAPGPGDEGWGKWFLRVLIPLALDGVRFLAVVALMLGAVYGLAFALLLLRDTVRAGWSTYILRASPPHIFTATDRTLYQWLIDLDLSACAAVVYVIVLYYTVTSSARNVYALIARFRGESSARGRPLFPEGLSSVFINLGLIGVLVSFVLAALTQAGRPPATPAPTVAVVAGQPAPDAAGPVPPGGAQGDPSKPGTPADEQYSEKIFLLLCAALFGTLVATVAAYVVIPLLERLNALVLGRMLKPADAGPPATPADIDQHLAQALAAVAPLAGQLGGAAEAITAIKTDFGGMNRALASASGRFETTAKTLERTTGKLNTTAGKLETAAGKLEALPAALDALLQSLKGGLAGLEKLATSAAQGVDDLVAAAKSLGGSLVSLDRVLTGLEQLAKRVPKFLEGLLASEQTQAESLKLVNETFKKIETRFDTLATEFEKFNAGGSKRHTELVEAIGQAAETRIAPIGATLDTLEATLRQIGEQLTQMKTSQDELRKEVDDLKRGGIQFGRAIDRFSSNGLQAETGSRGWWFLRW
jgi:ABC-type transporter Mla subunit MlaD